jgi:predicted permease
MAGLTTATMDAVANDLRHAVRTFARAPGFAIVVVLTLAVGIGASTAVFSLVNGALLRPLAFAEPDRLVALHEGAPALGFERTPFSPPDLLDVQRDQRSFEAVGAYRNLPLELSGRGDAERIVGAKITANLFPLLGAEPALGRLFTPDEDRPGNNLALISWELWQRRYAGSDAAIGESIELDRRPHTIIGVMPRSFGFPPRGPTANGEPADVWTPMAFTEPEVTERGSRFNHSVVARLEQDVTVTAAQADLDVLARRIANEYPPVLRNNADALQLTVRPLREEIAGAVRAPLLMLFAAIGLVLLVACANVANLLLSRAAAREREAGIRAALGASRSRLFQRLATEALLLTFSGGVLGVALARWVVGAVPIAVARAVPGIEGAPLDVHVLAFAVGVATATGIVFGALPVLTGRRDFGMLRDAGGRATPWRQHRLQNGLVVTTVALAFVLLVGAGLFVRSFSALLAADPGFRSAGVLSVSLALPQNGYPTAVEVRGFHERALERVAAIPGVQSVAVATDLPLESYETRMFTPERARLESGTTGSTQLSWVHGPYFETLGIRLVAGRLFLPEEQSERRPVVIINEALANRLWPDGNAVGQRLKWGPREAPGSWLTIVGVVSDVAGGPAVSAGLPKDKPIRAYEPFRSFPDFFLDNAVSGFGRDVRLAVRTYGDPSSSIAPLRRELASLDPQLAIARIAPMDDLIGERIAPQRFTTALLATFGGGALLLVAIGLYGLLSFTVEQRRREIGVRVALGAEPRKLVRMMVGKGLKLVSVGVAFGLAGAVVETRLLGAFLSGVGANDPITFVAVPLVLVGVALLAAGLPAHRAARLDPTRVLREE